jgi:hypothetical protein
VFVGDGCVGTDGILAVDAGTELNTGSYGKSMSSVIRKFKTEEVDVMIDAFDFLELHSVG